MLHDKPLYVDLNGGCCTSKRRIDLRELYSATILSIEIDENGHSGYDKQDEKERYDNLFMDFAGKYIFIRFNPDGYKDSTGRKINIPLQDRLPRLLEEIRHQINRIENDENIDPVEIHYLYYNGFSQ